ncbi:two-component hybrid sensor and regulator [Minicystis rosea]|nr:two-component hybrid sensor and regulator [Minicystis rosea]
MTVTVASDAPPVMGDADRLQQVVGNLLSNALKFTPKNGSERIELGQRSGAVELRVIDTGAGVAVELQPFVFNRFWQAETGSKRQHGGLGIGLAVVRHIVDLHGGSVHVENDASGRGAIFAVRLPPAPAVRWGNVEPLPETARSAAPAPDLAGLDVLVVEDEPDSRELLRETLERCHARVTAVGSVSEAIDALASSRPHVLVSDIAMPGADGYDLIRHLRSLGPADGGDIPAIALSAFTRSEDRARALAAGFQMHASKPVEPIEVSLAVARLAASTARPPPVDG